MVTMWVSSKAPPPKFEGKEEINRYRLTNFFKTE